MFYLLFFLLRDGRARGSEMLSRCARISGKPFSIASPLQFAPSSRAVF